jgi:hypothetical protein
MLDSYQEVISISPRNGQKKNARDPPLPKKIIILDGPNLLGFSFCWNLAWPGSSGQLMGLAAIE